MINRDQYTEPIASDDKWSLNDEQQCAEQMEKILQKLKEGV